MADDTPTIEQARQALIDLLISPNDPKVVPLIDALIAAVRADDRRQLRLAQILVERQRPS
jgi:hypothetical protein